MEKNKKKLAISIAAGAVLSLPLAMGVHYIYDIWPNLFTSLFFPVNESIWEHNKLFVLPIMLVYLIIYFIVGKNFKNYIPATFATLLYMPLSACLIYHIYLMISPVHHAISGILCSGILFFGYFFLAYKRTVRKKQTNNITTIIIIALIVIFVIIMAVFTYYPPKATWLQWLFMDSENMCHGIIPH